MIVKCPKCGEEYNCDETYYGKKFACRCGEFVYVPNLKSSPQPKPIPKPVPPKKASPAPVLPVRRSSVVVEKIFSASTASQLGMLLREARKSSAAEKTIYGLLAQIVSAVCVLCEILAGISAWKFAEKFPIDAGGPILGFVIVFIPTMFLIFFFFSAIAAVLRIADCVCRSSGVRPTLF